MRAVFPIAMIQIALFVFQCEAYADDDPGFEAAMTKQYQATQPQLHSLDAANRAFEIESKRKIKNGIPLPSPADRERAIQGVKMLAYNKAINHVRCAYDLRKNLPPNTGDIDARFKACNERRNNEMVRFSKLSDYDTLFDRKKQAICELKSRDFEMERRFPTF